MTKSSQMGHKGHNPPPVVIPRTWYSEILVNCLSYMGPLFSVGAVLLKINLTEFIASRSAEFIFIAVLLLQCILLEKQAGDMFNELIKLIHLKVSGHSTSCGCQFHKVLGNIHFMEGKLILQPQFLQLLACPST